MDKTNQVIELLFGPKKFREVTSQAVTRLKCNVADSSKVKFDRYLTKFNLNEFKVKISPYYDNSVEIEIISIDTNNSWVVVSELSPSNIVGSIKDIITKLFNKTI